jgi:hypothetical protein
VQVRHCEPQVLTHGLPQIGVSDGKQSEVGPPFRSHDEASSAIPAAATPSRSDTRQEEVMNVQFLQTACLRQWARHS